MSAEGEPLAADAEPDLEHGPCMMALTPKQRAFVMAMARNPLGTHKDWAKEAGYARRGLGVRAFETYHDPKVQSAIMEVAKGLMGAEGPLLAVTGLLAIAKNPKHQSHVKVLELLANRVASRKSRQSKLSTRIRPPMRCWNAFNIFRRNITCRFRTKSNSPTRTCSSIQRSSTSRRTATARRRNKFGPKFGPRLCSTAYHGLD